MVAAKLRTFLCTPNKTLLALPSVAGTLTRGLTRSARILAHVLAPQSLALCTLSHKMKLIEVIEKIDDLDEEATIWVKVDEELNTSTKAVVAAEDESGLNPIFCGVKYSYLLEVFIAKEIIETIPEATTSQKVDRIINYAINDA